MFIMHRMPIDSGAEPAATAAPSLNAAAPAALAATALAAIRSVVAYFAIALYVLLVAPPAMLLAIAFRWKGLLYVLGHCGVRLGLLLSGIRYAREDGMEEFAVGADMLRIKLE